MAIKSNVNEEQKNAKKKKVFKIKYNVESNNKYILKVMNLKNIKNNIKRKENETNKN